MEGIQNENKIWSVLKRIVIAATVYHVWVERNKRLFQNTARDCGSVKHAIIDDVRLKMASLKVQKSKAVKEVANLWNIQW